MARILIVGAGAVGSVYGNTLQEAGADVSFLVKPKHVAERSHGMTLYPHRLFQKKPQAVRFTGYHLHDSIESLPQHGFETVIITVPSNALRASDWLKKLASHPSTQRAYWLCLSPGMHDAETVLQVTGVEKGKIAEGGIPIMSYWAPLPGQSFEENGYAWWLPPGKQILLSPLHLRSRSEQELKASLAADPYVSHWNALAALFAKGGIPAKIHPHQQSTLVLSGSMLRCIVSGLELSEWSFQKLFHSPTLHLVSEAAHEATAIHAAILGMEDPLKSWIHRQIVSPMGIRLALSTLARITPFDLETFLRVHFTKVETQMHLGIQDLIQEGSSRRLPNNHLRQLGLTRNESRRFEMATKRNPAPGDGVDTALGSPEKT